MIYKQQKEYYIVLGEADKTSDCTCFITFILQAIADALKESTTDNQSRNLSVEIAVEMAVENKSKRVNQTDENILTLLRANSTMTIPELAQVLNVSVRTIERHISQLQKSGMLIRVGSTKAGHWTVI